MLICGHVTEYEEMLLNVLKSLALIFAQKFSTDIKKSKEEFSATLQPSVITKPGPTCFMVANEIIIIIKKE